MSSIHVRGASLDDTRAISGLFCARIGAWQRLTPDGRVQDVPYESLAIYERWLHGGPWMSVETGAMHLSRLLRGAGISLVGEADGQVVAYAEAYAGLEPEPFGDHLHLAQFTASPLVDAFDVQRVILADLMVQARVARRARVTALLLPGDSTTQRLYAEQGMDTIAQVRRYALPARAGQVFYQVTEEPETRAERIKGWRMPLGRLGSARQQWEAFWPLDWQALAEMRQRPAHRLHVNAAGQEALLFVQQQLYVPRGAEVYAWTPKPLTTQVLAAIRDWTHRQGYRTLVMAATEETAQIFGAEAEAETFAVEFYGVAV